MRACFTVNLSYAVFIVYFDDVGGNPLFVGFFPLLCLLGACVCVVEMEPRVRACADCKTESD